MKPPVAHLEPDAQAEIYALVELLHKTGRHLEELTAGEVDAVADQQGQAFLLRHAQDHLREAEAAKQAAILNALPAHIALLDPQGFIISVNEAWRQFGQANALRSPQHAIGANYLAVCDAAHGMASAQATAVAQGLRDVLSGQAASFSMEYACDSPTQKRWFLMRATALVDQHLAGAVVMHVNITDRKRGEESLLRFSAAMDVIRDPIYLIDRASMRFVYVNEAACRLHGRSRDELLAVAPWRAQKTSRTELERIYDGIITGQVAAPPVEIQRRTMHGLTEWVELRRHAQCLDGRWAIVTLVRDVTERKLAADALQASETRFRSLTELSSDWFWEQDAQFRFVMFSGTGAAGTGPSRQSKSLGLRGWEIPGMWPVNTSWEAHKALLEAHGSLRDFVYRRDVGGGVMRYVEVNGEPVFDSQNTFTGYRGVATDITQRKLAEDKIAQLNRVYAVTSSINALIVRVHDRDELFAETCRIAVELGGFRMALVGGVDNATMKTELLASAGVPGPLLAAMRDLVASAPGAPTPMFAQAVRDRQAVLSNDAQNQAGVAFAREYAADGVHAFVILPLMVSQDVVAVLLLFAGEMGFFGEEEMKLLTELAGNISFALDHLAKETRLEYLAYYDALTGLANRNLFLERLAQHMRGAAAAGHKLAVCLLDLERFKNINDSLGRPAGDELLVQVARWLASTAGDASLLARMGPDLFAVVLPQVRRNGDLARLVEKKLTAFLAHPFRLNDTVLRMAFKAGVALFPDDGTDAYTLVRNVEAALKNARARGDRYLFYTAHMTEAVQGRLTLENQLRLALERNEYVLHYQPKINLTTGKLTGAEALIRWNDPATGLVPPAQFIPILEATGMISDVGRWAVRQAVADYRRWRLAGLLTVPIAVNVSAIQLRQRGFVAELARAIGVDTHAASGLELEITESLVMEDVKYSVETLHAIRGMGIAIAIDDFGTGFSSLSYLSKLPVDTLKIDRSFVLDMTAVAQGLSLVSTIINMAHALKLKVVAEGVETEEQQRLLRLLNCDEMQGYLFCKPLPVGEFETRFLKVPD